MNLIKVSVTICVLWTAMGAYGQAHNNAFDRYRDQKRQQFNETRETHKRQFDEFRRKRNEEFADFLRKKWQEVKPDKTIPQPKEEPVPPVVTPKDEPVKDTPPTPIPYDEVVPAPKPAPQPKPVDPIEEQPEPSPVMPVAQKSFVFFGTPGRVRFDDKHRIRLNALNENAIADCWLKMSQDEYTNLVYDCLKLRTDLNLSDWAYLMMLQQMAEAIYGKGTNEATLLTAYVYCQSGYKMRLGYDSERLLMFFASKHLIYDWHSVYLDGEHYYLLDNKPAKNIVMSTCSYPKEQSMSLMISKDQGLAMKSTDKCVHQSRRNQDMAVSIVANRNMLDFYSSYPTSMIDNNFMTRWAMYANTPMPKYIRDSVYPQIRKSIQGADQLTAVNKILNFIQTGFEYEYDDKVWGHDRAFFPEESLHYPYCDCEDRSILLTRLVRDLLGLKCILIYYPGHLAAAVAFTEGCPQGDYIEYGNTRFFIADPTIMGYGAPVGMTMDKMDNRSAKIILID